MKNIIALVSLLLVTQAHATFVPPAEPKVVVSPNGRYIVRIVPGAQWSDPKNAPKKPPKAFATYYWLDSSANYKKLRRVPLVNPVAPSFAAVNDEGELVTVDDYDSHFAVNERGPLTVYARSGRVLRSYSLADIFTKSEIGRLPGTGNYIQWRCRFKKEELIGDQNLYLVDALGGEVVIDLKTGLVERSSIGKNFCNPD